MMHFLRIAGLMITTTIGAGMFALPYVIAQAGWIAGVLYLTLGATALSFVHVRYLRAVHEGNERYGLVGFVRRALGHVPARIASFLILGGLTLALVIYLILAGEFFELLFPGGYVWGVAVMWFFGSLPLLTRLSRLVMLELVGCAVIVIAIFLIFFDGVAGGASRTISAFDASFAFLPFGAMLFALTGWTAVEPVAEYAAKSGVSLARASRAMTWGTVLSALLYGLFALGIFWTSGAVTPNAVAGAATWPLWKFGTLLTLGIFAMWTSYVPIALEIKNGLHKDIGWRSAVANCFVFLAPLVLFALVFKDFLSVLGIAGTVFLGLEYAFILLATKGKIKESRAAHFFSYTLVALFALAAVYEIWLFIVQ